MKARQSPNAERNNGTVNLAAMRRVHVVGIGGAGMSAIAVILLARGLEVSGSDLQANAQTEDERGNATF
ncbi:MAG: Mur ligase domain-containing protein, partial [Anaerolineae bacterium]